VSDNSEVKYGRPSATTGTSNLGEAVGGADTARRPVTVPEIRARKGGMPLTMVTAYDATFARMLDDAGIEMLLVGDSLGMVVQGNPDTLGVGVDDIVYHCKAVARGNRWAHVVGDMPFLSYQVTPEEAVRNAGRILAEGRAHAVKLEGGAAMAATIRRIVDVGIPVMAHVGLTPQSVHALGGFRVQGRDDAAAQRILADAHAVTDAGAYALVLEGIPGELAARITEEVSIPTIGIGAGVHCDGQVLVCYDLLGMTADLRPKFVKRYDEGHTRVVGAAQAFRDEVRRREFPGPEHTFGMRKRPVPVTGTG